MLNYVSQAGLKIVGNLKKMRSNLEKHDVSFQEAEDCIWSSVAIVAKDEKHSTEDENRFILTTISPLNRVIIIVFCRRPTLETRIISARPANRKERKQYFSKYKELFGEPVEFKTTKSDPGILIFR